MVERYQPQLPIAKKRGFFKPGNTYAPGRVKGVPNKITATLKELIPLAAANVGYDGKGKDGLLGYLQKIAEKDQKTFAQLLGRLLPLQLTGKDHGPLRILHIDASKLSTMTGQELEVAERLFGRLGEEPADVKQIEGELADPELYAATLEVEEGSDV